MKRLLTWLFKWHFHTWSKWSDTTAGRTAFGDRFIEQESRCTDPKCGQVRLRTEYA